MLSGGTHRLCLDARAKKMKILHILFSYVVIEPTTCRIYCHTLHLYVLLRHDWPPLFISIYFILGIYV